MSEISDNHQYHLTLSHFLLVLYLLSTYICVKHSFWLRLLIPLVIIPQNILDNQKYRIKTPDFSLLFCQNKPMESEALDHQSQPSQLRQIACPHCDMLHSIPALSVRQTAHCVRCGTTLLTNQRNSIDRSLAFAITGLILFVISNMFPLLSLKALGVTQDGTLLSTAIALFNAERPFLSLLILMTTFIFPATTLLGTMYVLYQVKTDQVNEYTAPLFRFLRSTDSWGMLEIMMLAILVAIVKLGDVADVIFGASLYAFCLLIITFSMLSLSLNPHDVWNKLRHIRGCQL